MHSTRPTRSAAKNHTQAAASRPKNIHNTHLETTLLLAPPLLLLAGPALLLLAAAPLFLLALAAALLLHARTLLLAALKLVCDKAVGEKDTIAEWVVSPFVRAGGA